MKKFHFFVVISLFALIVLSCGKKAASDLADGIFSGEGEGRNGKIEVSVEIKKGKVASAKIVSESETPEIGGSAEAEILDYFIQDGSTKNLDAVSGATLTSNGLLEALDDAMAKAQGKAAETAVYSDTSCDIVIIGAGGAGLVAATEAASKGAKVIVLEKMGIVGGNTNYSTGGINAAYTKEQQMVNIKDSKEVFFEDTMKGGYNLNDPELVHTLVDNSAAIVEWLQSSMIGADLSEVGMFGGATNKRIHRPQGGGAIGAHLVPLLHRAAKRQGAEIRLNSKVTDIIPDETGAKAAGVRVQSNGSEYTVRAGAVIIATGGFGANPEMIEKYKPELKGFSTTNHKGATGDAFAMVEKFGAALTQMEQIQTHPTVVPGTGIMLTEAVRGNGAILVGREGKRFVNEMANRDVVSAAILKEPQGTAFLVFDRNVRSSLKAIESYAKQGLLTEAKSISELAEKLKIPAEALEKTVESYNNFVQTGDDTEFGRPAASMEIQLKTAPFYAVECEPAVHHTMGGLKISTKAQVMDTSGKAIPALFAAGEVTGGVHGGNRLGGNAVADICIFGKIAADSALEYIGK